MSNWRDEFTGCSGGACSPSHPCCDACAKHDECHQDWDDQSVAEAADAQKHSAGGGDD